MRTLAEALAENEFYARVRPAPAGPTRKEKAQKRIADKMALLSGFIPRSNVGSDGVLRKAQPST